MHSYTVERCVAPLAHHSYEGALKAIAFELEKRNLNDSVALIGHRIAHGGSIFTESAIITDEVIDNIRRVSPLAPLHNYANLSWYLNRRSNYFRA